MSIQDEATRVISGVMRSANRDLNPGSPSDYVRALADAGLLRDDTEITRLREELDEMTEWANNLTGRPSGLQISSRLHRILAGPQEDG